MPFYRDTGSMAPQKIQDILSWMGMRDPRAAVPGPATTIGPRAIPLEQTDDYLRQVLGSVLDDMGVAMRKPLYQLGLDSRNILEGAVQSKLRRDPSASLVVDLITGPAKPSSMSMFLDEPGTDSMVQWLANLFSGVR